MKFRDQISLILIEQLTSIGALVPKISQGRNCFLVCFGIIVTFAPFYE
jgi:hypothetical protein